jgi:hypothetical protein
LLILGDDGDECGQSGAFVYLADEPVASPGERLDISGFLGGVAERVPQPSNGGVDALIEFDNGFAGPEFAPDFLARDQIAGPLQEHEQDLKRLILQPDFRASFTQFPRADVKFE